MLIGYNHTFQALLGTLFTWGLTAAGSALVFVFSQGQRKVLDGSLGFAGGVMLAASYWSLLAPAIELAASSGLYGSNGEYSFIPVAFGFALGALFVYISDILLPYFGVSGSPNFALASMNEEKQHNEIDTNVNGGHPMPDYGSIIESERNKIPQGSSQVVQRKKDSSIITSPGFDYMPSEASPKEIVDTKSASWKRIVLLIVAITIHNIPEGLAVGVGFGAIGTTKSATFENARNLAIGIGIQNFPEGLAVSLPLRGSGYSVWKSFWYGQLSGMVEPIAGVLGALAVSVAEPILPYALAFAAGAMVYVVFDDIIPEAQMCGNGKLASWGAIVGFIVMMSLDVGLG